MKTTKEQRDGLRKNASMLGGQVFINLLDDIDELQEDLKKALDVIIMQGKTIAKLQGKE